MRDRKFSEQKALLRSLHNRWEPSLAYALHGLWLCDVFVDVFVVVVVAVVVAVVGSVNQEYWSFNSFFELNFILLTLSYLKVWEKIEILFLVIMKLIDT